MKYVLGIDIGGTNLRAIVADKKGKVVFSQKMSLLENNLIQRKNLIPLIVKRIGNIFSELNGLYKNQIHSVGLVCAGPMDVNKGTLIKPTNWTDKKVVPFKKLLTQELKSKGLKGQFILQNDAMGAAFGELWKGLGKNCQSLAVITVGTGIGTGLILNREPVQTLGVGSEMGHSLIHLDLSKPPMSIEYYCGGKWMLRRASKLGIKVKSGLELSKTKEGKKLFKQSGQALGLLCHNISTVLRPELIIFTGGQMASQKLFLPTTISTYKKSIHAFNPFFEAPIKVSKLGELAGSYGAAYLALVTLPKS